MSGKNGIFGERFIAMNIPLPKRIDGGDPVILENVRQLTVIGANGAGKTRFSRTLMQSCGDKAFAISALKALFPRTERSSLPGSIDRLFEEKSASSHFMKDDADTEFDRLMFILLHDEFLDMLRFKAQSIAGNKTDMPNTKLDVVARRWEEVFPKNHLLRESGRLLFSNDSGDEPFAALRLSDGEKAVLYYIGAALYAPQDAVIFVDDPESFLHHSIMQTLWNVIESMRTDCTFVYNTHDVEFASSRIDNVCVWVRNFDAVASAWDYEVVAKMSAEFSDQLVLDLLGSRKPVLFVEGDETHSLDSRFYPLIFTEYTVKPLGSCNKVIESTRSFNDLRSFHHLDSHGIVDRDRREDKEVQYLREKNIFVPNVAEIENIFMLEGIIRTVAVRRKRNPESVFFAVRDAVIAMFRQQLKQQALQHVRHRVKRKVEVRIDRRFQNISALEEHMSDLVNEIDPRGMYESICRQFHDFVKTNDYAGVLKVFNEKSMLGESGLPRLCNFRSKDDYITFVLNLLKEDGADALRIRTAVKHCFGIG